MGVGGSEANADEAKDASVRRSSAESEDGSGALVVLGSEESDGGIDP